MVKNIIYGNDGNGFYVQTCCDKEHYAESCECKSYGEGISERKAKRIATKLSNKMKVDIKKVY